MIELIRELFQYQAWADVRILESTRPYGEDADLSKILRHIVVVQRFFVSQCAGMAFDADREMRPPEAFDELEMLFREGHQAALALMGTWSRRRSRKSSTARPSTRCGRPWARR